jgi:hypothetical protein
MQGRAKERAIATKNIGLSRQVIGFIGLSTLRLKPLQFFKKLCKGKEKLS